MIKIKQSTIEAIARMGFDVYMRDGSESYLFFTDGIRIGYLQQNWLGFVSISTVHIPNSTSGRGFRITDSLSEEHLTRKNLSKAFLFAPHWAGRHLKSVKKWNDFAHFRSDGNFNASYKIVAAADPSSKAYPSGAPKYAADGTMLDEKGNRSIFDDVDE